MRLSEIDMALALNYTATNSGAGTLSQSFVLYSFGNSSSLASVLSAGGSTTWVSGTATAAGSASISQYQLAWSGAILRPLTFASTLISPGEYVAGLLLNFSFATSSWSVSLYGGNAASLTTATVAAATALASTAIQITQFGISAASAITGLTQNATNNISWMVSRATSAATSVASATSSFTFVEVPFVGSLLTLAGSFMTGSTATNVVTSVALNALGTTTLTHAITTLLNFSMQYLGTSSSIPASVYPNAFNNGILSTNATPAAITLTSSAMISTGSTALIEPWIALVGA
jgi:hypothetical protein